MKLIPLLLITLLLTITSALAIGTFPSQDVNMQAHYHFNNNATGENATTVVDFSGKGSNLTIFNGTSNANACGGTLDCPLFNATGGFLGDGAYELDGYNDNIRELGNATSTHIIDTPLTLAVWFKVDGFNTSNMGIAGRTFSSTRWSYGCYVGTNSNVLCQLNNNSGTLTTMNAGTNSLSINNWYLVVLTYDPNATSSNAKMYVNGYLNQTGTAISGSLSDSGTQGLNIGRWGGNNQNYYNGSIDEVIIWNRSLTAPEIWNMYHNYYGCITPSAGMQLGGNTTYCQGNYTIHGTSTGGIKLVTNMVINATGSNFTGNYSFDPSTDSRLYLPGDNVTIIGGYYTNYYRVVYSSATNSTGISIQRATLQANKFGFTSLAGAQTTLIQNNTFINNENDVYYSGSCNNVVQNNVFVNTTTGYGVEMILQSCNNSINNNLAYIQYSGNTNAAFDDRNGNNNVIRANTIYGSDVIATEAIRLYGTNHSIVRDNYMDKTQYAVYGIGGDKTNISVINNTMANGDEGSVFEFTHGLLFRNNTVSNMTQNYDGYNIGLKLLNGSNLYIEGNNFSEIATVGIVAQGNENVTITSNLFDFINLSYRSRYKANDGLEPRCAIQSTQRYKGFYQSYGNTNLTLRNNNFDSDTPCYLHLENQTTLNHDLSTFWHRAFKADVYFAGREEFYIPINYDNLSRYSGGINYNFRIGYGSLGSNLYVEHNQSKDYSYYRNINNSIEQSVIVYNLTRALIYYTNNTVVCTNITNCNNNINITLPKGNKTVVLNDFNLTESVSRELNPLWVSSRADTGKIATYTLANNLSSTLYGVGFEPAGVPCGGATYVSHTGAFTNTASTTCVDGLIQTVLINGYEPASSSNTLTINYQSGSSGGSGTSEGGSTSTGQYNTTKICAEAKAFRDAHKKDGVILYNMTEYATFKNKLVISEGLSMPDTFLRPYIDTYETKCPASTTSTTNQTENPPEVVINLDDGSYMPIIIVAGVFLLVILIILMNDFFNLSAKLRRKPKNPNAVFEQNDL